MMSKTATVVARILICAVSLLTLLICELAEAPKAVAQEVFVSEVLAGKQCGACGKMVRMSAKVGERCEHCGTYWGYSMKKYIGSKVASEAKRSKPRWTAKRHGQWRERLKL